MVLVWFGWLVLRGWVSGWPPWLQTSALVSIHRKENCPGPSWLPAPQHTLFRALGLVEQVSCGGFGPIRAELCNAKLVQDCVVASDVLVRSWRVTSTQLSACSSEHSHVEALSVVAQRFLSVFMKLSLLISP